MLMSYLTIPYSDYLLDPYFKYQIGWFTTYLFAATLGLNILFIVGKNVHGIFKKCKKKSKEKQKKEK